MLRRLIAITALAAGFISPFLPDTAFAQDIKVTLLGTGSPPAVMNRFGPSILVEAGGRKFLFDAGRGTLQRLNQLKVKWQDVDGVFFTHLHSDHTVGFPDAWLTGWLTPGRDRPLAVWGPPGTKNMVSHLSQAFEFDIGYRISDDKAVPAGAQMQTTEITPGVAYDQNGLKITAIEVDHAPVKPAYGYRIDFNGRSVVLSGDTRVSGNLEQHAKGVDLLVHEVVVPATFQRAGSKPERAKSVTAHHTTPEEAGEVFTRTKPKLAVYSHIVLPSATTEELMSATRKTYHGPVVVGEDLMAINVGNEVIVHRPNTSNAASR
jgi:ribonuclease Z